MLDKEFDYYCNNLKELLKKYGGKFLVIKDQKVIGVHDSLIDAANAAREEHEMGTFLLQHCTPEGHIQHFRSPRFFLPTTPGPALTGREAPGWEAAALKKAREPERKRPTYMEGVEDPGERWENATEHDPRSLDLFKSLSKLDIDVQGDYFCFKSGGDGDNGETLMYLMDIHFELADKGRI